MRQGVFSSYGFQRTWDWSTPGRELPPDLAVPHKLFSNCSKLVLFVLYYILRAETMAQLCNIWNNNATFFNIYIFFGGPHRFEIFQGKYSLLLLTWLSCDKRGEGGSCWISVSLPSLAAICARKGKVAEADNPIAVGVRGHDPLTFLSSLPPCFLDPLPNPMSPLATLSLQEPSSNLSGQ